MPPVMIAMMSVPMSVPWIVPSPPVSAAPPTITAPMTRNSKPAPDDGSATRR